MIPDLTLEALANGFGHLGSASAATGISAQFNNPIGITTDGTNLYVAEYMNHSIRKIVISTAVVTTIAGSTRARSGTDDGTGPSTARSGGTGSWLNSPQGITTDGTNLYVADKANHRIRKIE